MANYLSYDRLSQEYKVFLSSLNMTSVPKTVDKALARKEWSQAMDAEMEALQKNHIWNLVPLPAGKKIGSLEKYKARLVAKGYTQSYGIDYLETFAPIAKFNTMRILIALAAKLN
ncbi:unnamed protein product [Spirodela intermedia]|uniref:Reverse transcriptase Ty1/copia-type domain-containing protein n=1 Tax=Spirodela intermedia TaxID=51605 RepID=A0A7I8JM28_SPIIN|nr:unnamed protein product [Spirodela intermedia]CAA6671189.1 unnamed protein product [Spirodela intermedia]